jgi:hypothetical protein
VTAPPLAPPAIIAYRIHYPPVGTAFVAADHADEPGGPLQAARELGAEITPLVAAQPAPSAPATADHLPKATYCWCDDCLAARDPQR